MNLQGRGSELPHVTESEIAAWDQLCIRKSVDNCEDMMQKMSSHHFVKI